MTTYNWEEVVRTIDTEYDKESLRPFVWFFREVTKIEDQTQLYRRTDE